MYSHRGALSGWATRWWPHLTALSGSPTAGPVAWLWLVLGATSVAAFPANWGIGLFQAKNAVFITGACALVIWLVPNWALRGFLGWALVSFAWTGGMNWAMAGLLGLFAWALVYALAGHLSSGQWAALQYPITAIVGFQLAWMTLQAFNVDPIFISVGITGVPREGLRDITGWFGNAMDAALFLGLCLPLLLRWHWSLAAVTSLALVVWLRATVGIVAVALTWIWWGGLRRAWLTGSVAVAGGLAWASAFDHQGLLVGKRLVWAQTWHVAMLSPWVGWGPNALDYRVQMYQPGAAARWNFVFNEWLQGALEFGLVGVALAGCYAFLIAWRVARRWRQCSPDVLAGAAILFLASTFSIPFRIGPVALLGALYLGRLDAEVSR